MMMMTRWRWLQMADPIHGIMQFDRKDPIHKLLLDTVNCEVFQRLRRIKQMGLAEFVFPGAVHSRFNHSLGATHLMTKALLVFKYDRRSRQLLESTISGSNVTYECALLMAILLHDLGHSPLSHTLEDVLELHQRGLTHDYFWLYKLLEEDEELQTLWHQHGVGDLAQVLKRFNGVGEFRGQKHFLASLVSSQLDMDRLDYLLRDAHFMGTKYGNIESDRIISCLEISNTHEGKPIVTVLEDGVPAVEHYLFGRYEAYKMALHSLDKASEALLKFVLKRFIWAKDNGINTGHPADELYGLVTQGEQLPTHSYLRMDDCYLWEAIHCWSLYSEDELLKTIAKRMMRHDLPKFINLESLPVKLDEPQKQQLFEAIEGHYIQRGLSLEFGFDRQSVEQKPLYRDDKEPIWVKTRERGVLELPAVSSLELGLKPNHGFKDLLFLWDTEAKNFAQRWLNGVGK
ncbi:MAG: HD domain-containing protein [Vampirovibrio sp.]|nr:HD domain-containing protein [Vampirovibrio sp.]